jgi:glycosyltransferase involved in cell wall biosynthesis
LMAAHIGVVPLVKNPESDLVHTFKMYEYMQLAIPIVISRTTGVTWYFNDDVMAFFEPGDPGDLADKIIDLARDPNRRYRLAKHALQAYEEHSPEKQREAYMSAVCDVFEPEYPCVVTQVGQAE